MPRVTGTSHFADVRLHNIELALKQWYEDKQLLYQLYKALGWDEDPRNDPTGQIRYQLAMTQTRMANTAAYLRDLGYDYSALGRD